MAGPDNPPTPWTYTGPNAINFPGSASLAGNPLATLGAGGVVPSAQLFALCLGGYVDSVNFNSANTDTPITISLPAGATNYSVRQVFIANASGSLTTATCGLFTSTGGGGVAIVSGGSAITVSSSAANTNNNMMSLTVNNGSTQSFNKTTLYFRVGTAQGVAVAASVLVYIQVLP